jgi:hypothetical protein
MRARTTILLAVVAAAIFAFIHFVERGAPGTRELEARKRFVMTFDKEEVDRIVIRNSDERVVLVRRGERWQMREPVEDRADQQLVSALLDEAGKMPRLSAIEVEEKGDDAERARHKEFGVAKPGVRLKFDGKGVPPELLFGKETPVDGRVYVRFEGEPTVYVTTGELRRLVGAKPDAFRDGRLCDLHPSVVERLEIRTRDGEMAVERNAGRWAIVKPVRARANGSAVESVIAGISGLRIETMLRDDELGERRGSFALWASGDDKPQLVEVGRRDAGDAEGTMRAKVSGRPGAFTVGREIRDFLKLQPNDLRDRALARVEPDIVDRIAVEREGEPRRLLVRKGEGWEIAGEPARPVEAAAVARLFEELRLATVSTFVADVGTEPEKYGLNPGRVRVVFASYSSENTPESARGERPFMAVALGRSENGEVFARVEEEPFIVAVPAGAAERIEEALAALR